MSYFRSTVILVTCANIGLLFFVVKLGASKPESQSKTHVPTERMILPSGKLKVRSSGLECPNCYFHVPGRVTTRPFTAWNFCPNCGCEFVK